MRAVFVADFASEFLGYQEFLLATAVARQGHEVHLVTSCWNPPAPNYEETFQPLLGPRRGVPRTYEFDGVKVHRLPVAFNFRDRVYLKGLRAMCRELRPDVIFVHLTFTITAVRMATIAKQMAIPLFYDNHSIRSVQNQSPVSRFAYRLYREVLRARVDPYTSKFFGVANECSDFLREVHGVRAEKVELLPLGVDTNLFHADPDAGKRWRELHGFGPTDFVVTQTGKLDQSKDPLTLAKAVGLMSASERTVHLVFVGGGPKPYLNDVIAAAGTKHVHMLPAVKVDQLAEIFSGSDVVCFPGGTSMSALEAAACAAVVVMNDEPVSSWRASKGVGLTFPEKDPVALAGVLEGLRDKSADGIQNMGRCAQEAVVNEFSYGRIAKDLVGHFEDAIRKHKDADSS